jgi:membrane protein
MLPIANLVNVVKRSISEYSQDNVANMAAALAFAAFFSIFPLILFLVSLASFLLSPEEARQWVLQNVLPNLQSSTDESNVFVKTITDVVAARGTGTGIAALIGLVSLLLSASGVFGTLQLAINRAWECEKAGSLIKDKIIAFLMVLGVAAVMVLSTAISAVLTGIQSTTSGIIGNLSWLWEILNFLISLGLLAGVLAILYRSLPRCKVEWSDVWLGALITALLFGVLKYGFAFYLGNFAKYQAVYGALGAIIAVQTWIYLSSQVLLFGAEFCSEYAGERQDMEAERARTANQASDEQRRQQAAQRADERRQRREAEEQARIAGRTPVPAAGPGEPRQAATVFAAAAGVAAALGLLGKVLSSNRRG